MPRIDPTCAAPALAPRSSAMSSEAGGALAAFRDQLEWADRVRRLGGRWFDAIGFGPIETPSRSLRSLHGAELRAYSAGGPVLPSEPALLIVPAPIKRAYIW